ncbi:MAG: hypothetical protein OXG57_11140 [Acidimicrobiaceae bacterium]|nr:hypothetical protein [Acidimicrobiaceae bacterium]
MSEQAQPPIGAAMVTVNEWIGTDRLTQLSDQLAVAMSLDSSPVTVEDACRSLAAFGRDLALRMEQHADDLGGHSS